MNSRFKKLLISVFLLLIWFWYLYYVISNKVDDFAQNQELKRIEDEKVKQEGLKKKVTLEKKEEAWSGKMVDVWSGKTVDVNKKIEELRKKNSSYAYFKIDNFDDSFSFLEENGSLSLYFWDVKIWTFKKVNKAELWIKEVIWNPSYITIFVWNEKFLYNLKTKVIKNIDLAVDVEYIKSWINNLEFLFKTPVWIFVYTIQNNTLEYFIFFEDFVYYKNWYLWIIKKDEDIKLKNLWFEEEKQNLIIYYNPGTKEKNIIYKTDTDLKKIYYRWEKVYFEDANWDEYELKNLD